MIEIINLSHRFGNKTLGLDDITLAVREGEFVVIGGLNGSGKTTLLKHLNGLLLPDTGMVLVDGVPVSKNLMRARQLVGLVFQDADSQIVGETVYDDVAFGPENLCLGRDEIKQRVHDALTCVGLVDMAHQRPHVLSGGEKRRLAIAGILAMKPKILVFDEPFSNLDYPGIQQVLAQILSLHSSGHTILIATHDLEDVIAYADRLVLMKDGKVVKNGLPANLIDGLAQLGMREPRMVRSEMGI
jgi:biotin transport system ATP-binding protein